MTDLQPIDLQIPQGGDELGQELLERIFNPPYLLSGAPERIKINAIKRTAGNQRANRVETRFIFDKNLIPAMDIRIIIEAEVGASSSS